MISFQIRLVFADMNAQVLGLGGVGMAAIMVCSTAVRRFLLANLNFQGREITRSNDDHRCR
jgi:Zn-dependent alcohol dehydrogenase